MKSRLPLTYISVNQSFRNVTQDTGASQSCLFIKFQRRFRENWVHIQFQTDDLYCTEPPPLLYSIHRPGQVITSLAVASSCVFQNMRKVPVILRPGPRRMDLRDRMNMTGWYFHRMLLLLQLVAYMLAYNDTDHCQVCQTPLIQNPRVPWHRLINNTTYYFSGLKFRSMIWVLPKHSFVSGPYIQVCIGKSYHSPWKCLYRKVSNIRRTKSQNLNVAVSYFNCLYAIRWSQVLSREWRYSWSSADSRCSCYIWVINNLIAY